jgi:hypothetical protein
MARRVAREEGLLVGGSSGTAVAAAARVAAGLPTDAVLVVIMPDSGRGYMSKIFNDEWMIANGFIGDDKRKDTVGDVLRSKQPLPSMITVTEGAAVREALSLERALIEEPFSRWSRATAAALCRRDRVPPTYGTALTDAEWNRLAPTTSGLRRAG